MKRFLLVLALLTLMVPVAAAQTPVNRPTVCEFVPSLDHDAVDAILQQPIVARYELRFYLEGATSPVQTFDLGKPAPDNGKITVTNPAFHAGLAEGIRYIARVAAIGPSGTGLSDPSNPFGASRTTAPAAGSAVAMR